MVHACNARVDKRERDGPWGSLAGQSSLIGEPITSKWPCLQRSTWVVTEKNTHGWPPASSCRHTCTHMKTYTQTHAHTHKKKWSATVKSCFETNFFPNWSYSVSVLRTPSHLPAPRSPPEPSALKLRVSGSSGLSHLPHWDGSLLSEHRSISWVGFDEEHSCCLRMSPWQLQLQDDLLRGKGGGLLAIRQVLSETSI